MKLFEFDILEEGVAEVKNIGKICVIINDHVNDRMKNDRPKVTPDILNILLKRIPDVKNKFKPLDVNTEFKIWSKSLNLGLGMKKRSDIDGYQRVVVGTVLDKPLYDTDDIVFYVG